MAIAGRVLRGPGVRAIRVALLSTVALLALAQMPAFADGGDGGGDQGSGGASSLTGAGEAGLDGDLSVPFGSGGGGGGAGVTSAGDGGNGERGNGSGGFSAGGTGGAGGASNGASGGDGGNGTSNFAAASGGGGGAGAAGFVADDSPGAPVIGGAGGSGGTGADTNSSDGQGGDGGGGGAGGFGFVLTGDNPDVTLPASTGGDGGQGGSGGDGGVSTGGGGDAGGGGDGGIGVVVQGGRDTLTVGATEQVTGGDGGDGGDGGNAAPGFIEGDGGAGGVGGTGILASDIGALTILGTVQGGSGGVGGDGGDGGDGGFGPDGASGQGGIGVQGANLGIVLAGTVQGGFDGDTVVRASAIEFTGGSNTLSLRTGFSIIGNVVANGTDDVLDLGGSTDETFNVSLLGSPRFEGFEAFEKSGTSTWTLTGTTTETTPWTVTGGTLSISDGAALGDATGTLTLDGGALAVTSATTIGNGVSLGAGNGTIFVSPAQLAIASGVISGTGGLTKTGTGALRLSGVNSYTGGTTIAEGILIADTTSLQGDIVNNATLTFDQASEGTFAGDISGTGRITKGGSGVLILTGANSYSGGIIITNGTLVGNTTSLLGDINNGAALVFDQAEEGTYAGVLSGAGTFTKDGAGELTLTEDSSAYTGTTDILSGLLIIDGSLGGFVNIAGGALGGSGTLGNLSVASGGTLAPGNSIGTLNVVDITIDPDSIYEVEVNSAGASDLIDASGTATINGGTVNVVAFPDFALGTTYTILTAAGGIDGVGAFDSAIYGSDSIFITPTLTYDANNAFVTLAQTTDFADVAATPNQVATAEGIASTGSGELSNAILVLGSNAEARAAFDSLSGEIHGSAQTALLEDSRFAREAALDRLRIALGGVGVATGLADQELPEGTGLWAQGFGAWSHRDGDGNAAALDRNTGGLFIGGDAPITDDVTLGLMAGYSQSSLAASDIASSATIQSYTIGAYAGGEWDGFSLKGGVTNTLHTLDTSRTAAFTGFSDTLDASYGARTFQAHTEAAYSVALGDARFEPYANLSHVSVTTDGFTETGGAAALSSNAQGNSATFATIGVRGEATIGLGETSATLSGGIGWQHAFGDAPSTTHALAAGDAFTVAGAPPARDTLVLDAGLELDISDAVTFGLSYSGQIASGLSDHGAKASLNVRF
ncbi:autotransporter outer membrane beta-barrel domain-containing protein [Pelagibacterium halotolerans]|uniref:Autotransporter n=1 Tax=Pelagibacterium halotolerans (strain DSM 22347 / JCM 15775 / CGMCC 1.7692 / B2) TaxID=1082931 RepID=G4RFA7_PELHB|nr:autotransporter domain-containing protein [Pelagibacterium halotolerans]AEQ50975.1 autotransporter [Pelagibacterium halotolerans B2]QJR19130.1 autotransporter domain-containing protein [Pelagibacterium halotolerans]